VKSDFMVLHMSYNPSRRTLAWFLIIFIGQVRVSWMFHRQLKALSYLHKPFSYSIE